MKESDNEVTDLNGFAFQQFLERLNETVRQNAGPDNTTEEEIEVTLDKERRNTLQLLISGKINSELAKTILEEIEMMRELLGKLESSC